MNAFRFGLLALALIALGLSDAAGQGQDRKAKFKFNKGTTTPALKAEDLSGPLVPPEVLPKLQLTAQQKPASDKLAQEFAAKNKELVAKLPATATTTPFKGKFKGKGGAGAGAPPELTAVFSLRMEYEKKFEELLTEAQKKTYNELLARRAEGLLTGSKPK